MNIKEDFEEKPRNWSQLFTTKQSGPLLARNSHSSLLMPQTSPHDWDLLVHNRENRVFDWIPAVCSPGGSTGYHASVKGQFRVPGFWHPSCGCYPFA